MPHIDIQIQRSSERSMTKLRIIDLDTYEDTMLHISDEVGELICSKLTEARLSSSPFLWQKVVVNDQLRTEFI